jgi:hypothetical protein
MSLAQVTLVVALLEQVRQRPGLYIGAEVEGLIPFLNGMKSTCAVFGLKQNTTLSESVAVERGWEYDAGGIWNALRANKLTYQQIVEEIIAFEILLWKRTYNIAEQ